MLGWKGQLSLLAEKYSFTFIVGVFSLLIFVSFFYGDTIGRLTNLRNLGPVMSNGALFELPGLLLFFPTLFAGTVLWARRIARSYMRGELPLRPVEEETGAIEIAVPIMENAISVAKESNAQTIRIHIGSEMAGVYLGKLETKPTTN